ncbi:hypothetical protein Dimus_029309, partial [Dionaea muscipula]
MESMGFMSTRGLGFDLCPFTISFLFLVSLHEKQKKQEFFFSAHRAIRKFFFSTLTRS